MKYEGKICEGTFVSRPNRFIANVKVDGSLMECHVKNTGRCKELLVPGATVYLEEGTGKNRRTKYSVIAVKKGQRLINMDSQIPNSAAFEWVKGGGLFGEPLLVKREVTYGKSRFDLYVETEEDKIFIEVKGVTLEDNGVVRFPDAPTKRGEKHVYELCKAVSEGYKAYLLFVIQMEGVQYFEPNEGTDPDFAKALRYAKEHGVTLIAMDAMVTPESMTIGKEVEVRL